MSRALANKGMNRTRYQEVFHRELESVGALCAPVIPGVRPRGAVIMVSYISIYRGRILLRVGLFTFALLALAGVLLLAFGVYPLSAISLALIGLVIAVWVTTISMLRNAKSGLPYLGVSGSCSSGAHEGCARTNELGAACLCSCHGGSAA